MALDRIPADIRKDGGVARMADPKVITRYLNYFVYEVYMYNTIQYPNNRYC